MKKTGFTLVELIISIVLLGIIAYLGTNIISPVMEGYVDTRTKTFLFSEAQYGIERMSRELRNAIPNTIRVVKNGNGIQFVKFKDAGYYKLVTLDNITCYSINPKINDNVSIYNTKADYFYGKERIYTIEDNSTSCILNKNITQNSPYNRIYTIDAPVTFYLSNNKVYRNSNYDIIDNSTTGTDNGYIMLNFVKNLEFLYEPGTTNRTAVVKIYITMEKNDLTLKYSHEVHIRNVP